MRLRPGRARSEATLTGRRAPSDPVDALLSAAGRGATKAELNRQEETLAVFRAASSQARLEPPPNRSSTRRRFKPKLVGVAVGVSAALTGVAAAGATGALPAPLQRPAHRIFHAPEPAPRHDRPTPGPERTGRTGTASPTSPGRSTDASTTRSSEGTTAPTSSGRPSDSSLPTGPSASTPATLPTSTLPPTTPTAPPTTVPTGARSTTVTPSTAHAAHPVVPISAAPARALFAGRRAN